MIAVTLIPVHITLFDWILLGILTTAWIYQLYFYLRYIAGVLRRANRDKKGRTPQRNDRPPVSVIVCARNEAYNLCAYLPKLLEQDYPQFEVIVVDDGSQDNTHDVLEQYQLHYPHLHTTFVPQQARVRSTKKLALTLAIKAAKYDYLVLTDADCCPESNQWLNNICSNFTGNTEIVLGFGAYFRQKGFLNKVIAYDTLFNGLLYLGMALSRHPYMGVGRNLAYRKETFLTHKGFAGTLGQRAGDDDLFINKVATRHNTNVAINSNSVTWSVPKQSFKQWFQQKERHLGVAPQYRFDTKCRLTLEPVTRALFYAAAIAVCILSPLLFKIIAIAMLILRFCWQITIINVSANHFGTRRFGPSILLFDIWLPLNTLALMFHYSVIGKRRQRW